MECQLNRLPSPPSLAHTQTHTHTRTQPQPGNHSLRARLLVYVVASVACRIRGGAGALSLGGNLAGIVWYEWLTYARQELQSGMLHG